MKSGQINTSPWVWQQLKTPGVGAGSGVGIVGNKVEFRFHTKELVTKGMAPCLNVGQGRGVISELRRSGFQSQLSSQQWCWPGKSLSSLNLSFLLRQKKIKPLSKICKDEGRPCMQRPGRVLYPGSRCSVNDIFPIIWKPRTSPGRQLRLLLY